MRHGSKTGGRGAADLGPSQRQLRAGELVRHSLAQILIERDIQDPDLQGVSVTVTEVRLSPDLRHATCFVEPLGAGVGAARSNVVVAALNRAGRYLRGRLGKSVELKFTPELRFVHDATFDEASHLQEIFSRPDVARDLKSGPPEPEGLSPKVGPDDLGSGEGG